MNLQLEEKRTVLNTLKNITIATCGHELILLEKSAFLNIR